MRYLKIGIDQMESPDKNDGFTIRLECECLLKYLLIILLDTDKYIIKDGFYSWNQSEKFTGFVKKTINLNHDYKIYIVDGEANLVTLLGHLIKITIYYL